MYHQSGCWIVPKLLGEHMRVQSKYSCGTDVVIKQSTDAFFPSDFRIIHSSVGVG
jgi:hypothetical protein